MSAGRDEDRIRREYSKAVGRVERRYRLRLTATDAAIIFGAVMGLLMALLPFTRLLP